MKYRFRDSTHMPVHDEESEFDHLERLISGVWDRQRELLDTWDSGKPEELRNKDLMGLLNEYGADANDNVSMRTSGYLKKLEGWFDLKMKEFANEPDMVDALKNGLAEFKKRESDMKSIHSASTKAIVQNQAGAAVKKVGKAIGRGLKKASVAAEKGIAKLGEWE